MLGRVLYVVACLILPLLWGLLVYAITRAVEKRLPPTSTKKAPIPELEYYL